MASLIEVVRSHAPSMEPTAVSHLMRLVRSWGMLADLCFADLLLFVPIEGSGPERFVVVAQRRPATSQTLYRTDHIGSVADEVQRPLVHKAWREQRIVEGEITISTVRELASVECIPVQCGGRPVAVLTRESAPWVGRQAGELERVYLEIFQRFAAMIVDGVFPFDMAEDHQGHTPRVGDGAIVLDEFARVSYASPNAVSALHRAGVHANAEGMRLAEVGFPDDVVRQAFATRLPVHADVDRGPDITLTVQAFPLIEAGAVSGAMVLIRDISDLRQRDLMLLSKDATIREIHHRVKNNLQTISALLRLQGRRTGSAEARAAIEESVRRIRSIALVHETLSRSAGDELVFEDIVRPLIRAVEEGLVSPDRPLRFEFSGEAGRVAAEVATPLSVVVTELLQNVVDHAYPPGSDVDDPVVRVTLDRRGNDVHVRVADNGVGPPDDFDLDDATGLGLSIVRTLVTTELQGTITFERGVGGGTVVNLAVPVGDNRPIDMDPV